MTGVLVDTSVWVAHFRLNDLGLVHLLERELVLVHPLVIGELACGTPPERTRTLSDLGSLRHAHQASFAETLDFIESERLFGTGCGIVDLMLLASTLITPDAELWTHDKRLVGLAERFFVAHQPSLH